MDDLYYKIQVCLQKKDQEHGRLKFLTSRTTEESIKHIGDVCTSIAGFLETFKIPTKGSNLKDNQDCIQVFKYLVLNTAFKSPTYLLEDITNGHLADMCPSLSPYLLLEVLQHINYEEILAESILYIPLDLCVEILEIARRWLEYLEFDRAFNTLITLISNAYKKLMIIKDLGSQTSSFEEFSERLVSAILELITLFSSERIIRLDEVSDLKKYERYGIILKKILKMVRDSLESSSINLSAEKEKLYKITFGNQSPIQGSEEVMQRYFEELSQELMNLILKKIKEIDCNIYLGWAELDYDNSSISLQRSIGIDCFYFAEALKNNDQLPKFKHLIECLNQLASKPDAEIPLCELGLEELCKKAKGQTDYIKELMKRYKDWNESIFDLIEKNESCVDKDDCLYLLEYLRSIIPQPDREAYMKRVYGFVIKVLLNQSITDLYSITIEYLLNHDGCKLLDFSKADESFENFITHNATFKSSKNLRFVLISVIKNPKKVLAILLKMVIGHPNYEHVMISPSDFFLLAPILKIRTENGRTFLLNILGECMKNSEWNVKKFAHFIQVMEENKYRADEIFNDLFIPYLESESFNVSNINSVLSSVRKMQNKCTENLKIDELMTAIVKRISYLRKDTSLPKYMNGEILCQLFRVIEVFIRDQSRWFKADRKISIISNISVYLEPIDSPYFASLWHLTKQGIDIRNIMEDYERRCFIVMNKVKDQGVSERLRSRLDDFSFLNEDFLRHLILRSTELEYTKYGEDEVYRSRWFAYEALRFIKDKNKCKNTLSSSYSQNSQETKSQVGDSEDTATGDHSEAEDESNFSLNAGHPQEYEEELASQQTRNITSGASTSKEQSFVKPTASNKRKRKSPSSADTSQVDQIVDILQRSIDCDACDVYGEHVAMKLKTYDKKTQAIFQHYINNILFDADMGSLQVPDNSQHQPMSRSYYSAPPPYYHNNHQLNSQHYATLVSPSLSFVSSNADDADTPVARVITPFSQNLHLLQENCTQNSIYE